MVVLNLYQPIYIAYEIPSLDKHVPSRGQNQYPSGLSPAENPNAIYGPASSDNPTLILVDPIYDYYGNVVMPGYYELSLSDDKNMLNLTQSQTLVATFPVIMYKDNRPKDEYKQVMDDKTLKKQEKQKKKAAKKKKQDLEDGKFLTDPLTYNKATIEFDDTRGYYVIKYERGNVEAWGVIKPEF